MKTTKKTCIIATLISWIIVLTACTTKGGQITDSDKVSQQPVVESDSKSQTNISDKTEPSSDGTGDTASVTDNRATKDITIKAEDIATEGYMYEDFFGDTLYFMAVTNKSDYALEIKGNGQAKDDEGKLLAVDDMSITIVGPGETSIGYFMFEGATGISTVEYELSYKEASYYYPVLANLDVEQIRNDKNVILKVTNTGDINAQFVEAFGIFFDADGNVINYTREYISDKDSEIKVGATVSAQLDCYEGYTDVKVFMTGRSDGTASTAVESSVTDEDFDIITYMYEDILGDVKYYMAIKNNSDYSVGINGNATALDADGNILAVDDMSIEVIGAGQESIGYFYFDGGKGLDHVEYQLVYETDPSYKDVLKNLSIEQTINEENVIVSVKNNGSYPAEFVEAHALFFDADGNVVATATEYVTDDDSEIKPGETILEQLDAYEEFDTVKVWFTGRYFDW